MSAFIDASERDWQPLFEIGKWAAYLTRPPNQYGWCEITVRLLDAKASRRAWWLNWSINERRLAYKSDSDDLRAKHPQVIRALELRLRDRVWEPQL
jgi:hypothetical protein